MKHLYARAPNHLGDGVMALPALTALRQVCERMSIAAPGWGAELYRDLDAELLPRGAAPDADAAALFAPSFRAAWEARRVPVRVGLVGDGRALLLTHRLPACAEHRAEGYARVAAALGARVEGPPRFALRPEDAQDLDAPAGHLALAPLSPSGAPVMWPGFAALGRRSHRPVRVYLGPGESWEAGLPTRAGLGLGRLAAHLSQAAVLVANDSGLAHFGRAVGVPVVVVYGSTAPGRTGAAGSLAVEGPDPGCRPCYQKRCPLPGVPCLAVGVEAVEQALERAVALR